MNVLSQSDFKKYVVITKYIGICNQSFWPTCLAMSAFGGAIYSLAVQSFSVSMFWGCQPQMVSLQKKKKKKSDFMMTAINAL